MGIDGIVIVNKEQNMTSHDVVSKVRRIFGTKKVGHTGTLDPMATGVLPVCIGKATRIMEYLDLDMKEYLCTLKLGVETDTRDVWGTETARVSAEAVNAVTEADVTAALEPFHGVIRQVPPMYSALKVNGRKLYEYARAGETVEIKEREIYIPKLSIIKVELGCGYESSVTFSVVCSKGTYIRSICQDVGERLGVHAAMSALVRKASGAFSLEDSVTLAELSEMGEQQREALLWDIPMPLVQFGKLELSTAFDARRLINGMPVWTSHCKFLEEPAYGEKEFPLPMRQEFGRAYLAYGPVDQAMEQACDQVFLGVVFADEANENVKADKVFYTGNQ